MPFLESFYSKEHISEWPALKKMKVCHCSNIKILALALQSHQEGESQRHHLQALFFVDKVAFPNLEELEVSSMDKLLHLWAGNSQASRLFQNLENLKVSKCQSLKHLGPSTVSLCNLQILEVSECNKLINLVTLSTARSLVNVKRMDISDCRMIKQIITREGNEAINDDDLIVFNQLNYLRLHALPSLAGFCFQRYAIELCEITSNKPEEMNSEQSIQPLFSKKVGLPSLDTLIICQLYNLRKIWDDQLRSDSFRKLHTLQLILCHTLLNIFPSSMLGRLHALDTLDVWCCDSLKEIFELQALNDQKPLAVVATQLKELHFHNLPKLKHVWNMNAQQILGFENLIKIRVSSCSGLKSLFPLSIAQSLLKLEELVIDACDMNEIVAKEERTIEEATIPRFKFPRLSSLELSRMPFLESFYSKEHISEWPALKKMKVCHCSNIKILALASQSHQEGESQRDHLQALFFVDKVSFPNLEELEVSSMDKLLHLWGGNSQLSRLFQNLEKLKVSKCRSLKNLGPSTVSLCNLQILEVSECDKLINLVTLSTARNLVNVKRMDIADCRMIKEIITQEGDEAINDHDQIEFNQLNSLRLHALPSLTSFCSQSYTIDFPRLEQVIIGKYTMMELFCPGALRTPKLHKVLSTDKDDDQGHWQDNLNTTTQLFFKELVGFRGIESLKLSEFPQLKEKWHFQLSFSVFCNLRSLEVDECAHLSSAISTNMLLFLNNLKDLYVRNCDSVEEVLDLEKLNDDGDLGVLSQLSKLHLRNLPRLKYICRNHQEILDFRNLEFLKIQDCGNLRYMFTLPMISSLKHLQKMKISNCVTMEVIIINEAEKDTADEIVLPMLKSVSLKFLPELASFYSGTNIVECSSLKTISRNDCTKVEDSYENFNTLFGKKVSVPNLKKLKVYKMDTLRKIWDDVQLNLDSFSKLKKVRVGCCNQLLHIFPSIMTGRFQGLKYLSVYDCDSLEEMLELQAFGGLDEIVFKKLKYLRLECLPRLRGFYLGNFTLKFPSLYQVIVGKCSKMEAFSQGIINSPKLQGVKTYKEEKENNEEEPEWCWEGDLNTTIQHIFKKVNAQTSEQD